MGVCVGVGWGAVGVRMGGMHWARGAETFAHRPSQRQREQSGSHCFLSICVPLQLFSYQLPRVCVCVFVFYVRNLMQARGQQMVL